MKWESFKGPGCASVAFGDVHNLHPVVPTLQIIRCLMWALPDTPKTAKLDFVFINGDFFERLQSFNHPDVHLVIKWVRYFLKMAKKYGIKVRVLEGTPSHDWKQNLIFKTMNDDDPVTGGVGIGADLKYVDQIHIEYVEEHDMHILYVPDLKVDASDMWRQILDKMRVMDIDQVDYTLVHGAFHHQVPKVMHSSPHITMRISSQTLRDVTSLLTTSIRHQFTVTSLEGDRWTACVMVRNMIRVTCIHG